MNRNAARALAALALMASSAAMPGSAHANLLSGGDFSSGTFAGWGSYGNVLDIPQTAYFACCNAANADPSKYVASFGAGDGPDDGSIYQGFATVPGQHYTLSFDYGAFGVQTPQAMAVIINAPGVALDVLDTTLFSSGDFANLFVHYSYDFTATGTAASLQFIDQSGFTNTASVDGLLANVSIDPSAAVPEPASLALLAAGIAGLGLRRRAKR